MTSTVLNRRVNRGRREVLTTIDDLANTVMENLAAMELAPEPISSSLEEQASTVRLGLTKSTGHCRLGSWTEHANITEIYRRHRYSLRTALLP